MSPLAIFKLLKTAKDVHDYVKKPNNLDQQNEMILNRLDKLDNDSHPPIFEQKDKDDIIERISNIEKILNNSDSNRKKKKKNKKTDDKQWYDD